ncbi:DivIVA domain-containing protein [Phycicoccus sp. Root563]|uniref:DivIVA domain-containing protein n=1 Tax=Phycicoccus sp. Root563 TaxID=1736562 RepID=UPI0012FB81AF|nr:DivIVA domain-containing protein [Phycicoccus sp. Root563]
MLTSKDVMDKTLTPTQFHAGYDEREVDDLLDEVANALRYYEAGGRPGPGAPASPTPGHRFTSTKLRRGYDEQEVDEFLEQVIETFHYYEQGGRPDPQALAGTIASPSEGPGQKALRWLRGDPRS